MIKQVDSNSSLKEKKYKILSYSILLGNTDDLEKDKKELEETARYLDSANESVYEELLASKEYTTVTLEEEKDRLEDLISCINNRIREREEFNSIYFQVMHSYIEDLPQVKDIESLDYYKMRLKNISEYLTNIEDIKLTEDELDSIRKELNLKKENEKNSKIVNKKLESVLLEQFTKVIADNEYYTKLNYVDIDNELINLENDIIEKKSTLDTFMSSYEVLEKSGISGNERDEYKSYVSDVENDYYSSAEKKYLLNIYKLVLDTCDDYDGIYAKRMKINDILEERNNVRNKLEIVDEDKLKEFIDVCQEQFTIIQSQKSILDDINKLMLDMSRLNDKLDALKNRNNRQEILEILKEFQFNQFDKSDANDMDAVVEKSYDPSAVVSMVDAEKMNLDAVKSTASVVMKKVVMAIKPKKFTRRGTTSQTKNTDNNIEIKEEIFVDNNNSVGADNTFVEVNDPFVKESIDEIVFDNIDPFLDDDTSQEETLSNMPRIDNIGSVKPTTKLNEIEKMNDDDNNIVLPTMGLVDNLSGDVQLSSKNYLNTDETASN